jgi:hypothetical protein
MVTVQCESISHQVANDRRWNRLFGRTEHGKGARNNMAPRLCHTHSPFAIPRIIASQAL